MKLKTCRPLSRFIFNKQNIKEDGCIKPSAIQIDQPRQKSYGEISLMCTKDCDKNCIEDLRNYFRKIKENNREAIAYAILYEDKMHEINCEYKLGLKVEFDKKGHPRHVNIIVPKEWAENKTKRRSIRNTLADFMSKVHYIDNE